jgi:uroporphyrin-III C-methyltransferase
MSGTGEFSGGFWDTLPSLEPGWVWLVGGGPGDPGLITALGLKALAQAEVILHDALIDERLLALARPGTDKIYAGKRAGVKSCKQDEISDTLVRLAKDGKRVLRLKGGDPFVFGRGGEEAQALARARVPFRIVPGITAGIGGLAYAGIPLTHRDIASAATFVTGHDREGIVPETVDWTAIARGSPVIVLYMGLTQLARNATRLIAAGRPADEPVAIISRATTPAQRVVVASLADAAASAAAAGIEAPTIIVIGEVVRLHATLDWLGDTGVR